MGDLPKLKENNQVYCSLLIPILALNLIMNQVVIFDLDGVIIDSEPIHFTLEKQMFRELNIDVSFSEHNSYVGTSLQNMWESIIRKHKVSYDPGELTRRKNEIYLKYLQEHHLHPIEGVTELIKDLHKNNFKLLIASSSDMKIIEIVLKKFQLVNFFKAMVSGTELTHSKPHPEIFLKAAKLAECETKKCVVIEDSENGVKAARAAGMKCVGFLNPNSGNQDLRKANIIIKSFRELDTNKIQYLD